MRGDIFACDADTISAVSVATYSAVYIQLPRVCRHLPFVEVIDGYVCQWLVVGRVMSLNIALQLVSLGIVFLKESLAYVWQPFIGIFVFIWVNGQSSPKRYIIE